MPSKPTLRFFYVIGRDKEEAKESDFYMNREDAVMNAHFATQFAETQRKPLAKKGYDYNVYAVPADIYWEDLHDERDD